MTEPSISESRRTKIFLIKGFIYLVLVRTVVCPTTSAIIRRVKD